jgi:CheY-like chemotaxis protein
LTFEKLEDRRLLSSGLWSAPEALLPVNSPETENPAAALALVKAPANVPVIDQIPLVTTEIPVTIPGTAASIAANESSTNQDPGSPGKCDDPGTDIHTQPANGVTKDENPPAPITNESQDGQHEQSDPTSGSDGTAQDPTDIGTNPDEQTQIEPPPIKLPVVQVDLKQTSSVISGWQKPGGKGVSTSGIPDAGANRQGKADSGAENPDAGAPADHNDETASPPEQSSDQAATAGPVIAETDSSEQPADLSIPQDENLVPAAGDKDAAAVEVSPESDSQVSPSTIPVQSEPAVSAQEDFSAFNFTTEIDDLPPEPPPAKTKHEAPAAGDADAQWKYLSMSLTGSHATVFVVADGVAAPVSLSRNLHGDIPDSVPSLSAGTESRILEIGVYHRMPLQRMPGVYALDLGDEAPLASAVSSHAVVTSGSLETGPIKRGSGDFVTASSASVPHMERVALEGIALGPTVAQQSMAAQRNSGAHRVDGGGWWLIVSQFVLLPQFPNNHQPTIMLALADGSILDSFNVALVKENFMVLTASTAGEVIKQLRSAPTSVDVALLDVELPDVNGVNLLAKLREKYRDLPVMACTESASQQDIDKLTELGVIHLFQKPLNLQDFLATVREVIQQRHGDLDLGDAPTLVTMN